MNNPYSSNSFHCDSSNEQEDEQNYSSCLLQGALSNSVPCFMTASSPVPFSEISAEFSIPQLIPEVESVECTSVLRRKPKPKKESANQGKFKCTKCRKRYKTKGGLNLHLREHQPDVFLIRCPDCSFFTHQKANFAKHAAVKHRKDINGIEISEDINCSYCAFKCFTDEQLKLHLARKHEDDSNEKLFKCSECNYSSVEKSALGKHVAIVHKGKREFDCEICGFRSQTSSGLARHHRSHLESKPHQCHLCNMSYADKKRLRDHLLKHSDIKQYSCPNCKYATNRKDNLKMHIKRSHMPP